MSRTAPPLSHLDPEKIFLFPAAPENIASLHTSLPFLPLFSNVSFIQESEGRRLRLSRPLMWLSRSAFTATRVVEDADAGGL